MLRTHRRDADEIRRAAIHALQDVAGSDGGAWYELGMVDGDPVPVRWLMEGVDERVIRRQSEDRLPNPTGDPRLASRDWHSRFVLLDSLVGQREALQSTRIYQQCWAPFRIEDQLRMAVYHRGEFAGWIGVMRRRGEPSFSRADQRRVAPLARAIADAIVAARALDRAWMAREPGDLVVTPDGRIDYASAQIRDLAASAAMRRAVRGWVRAIDRGERVGEVVHGHRLRWSRLDSSHGSAVRYVIHCDPIAPAPLHQAFALSRTMRRIAVLAAAGATVPEIAEMLDVSTTTIRTHLRQSYEILHVSSRVELARALAGVPDEE